MQAPFRRKCSQKLVSRILYFFEWDSKMGDPERLIGLAFQGISGQSVA